MGAIGEPKREILIPTPDEAPVSVPEPVTAPETPEPRMPEPRMPEPKMPEPKMPVPAGG